MNLTDVAAQLIAPVDMRGEVDAHRENGSMGGRRVAVRSALAPDAQAQDFFSAVVRRLRPSAAPALHRDAVRRDDRQVYAPRGKGRAATAAAAARPIACGPATAAISRSPASDKHSRAQTCNSFCPASETKVFYGSNIDNAPPTTASPIRTCRTRSASATSWSAAAPATARIGGLAPVKIENDPTLRKGDIVAGENGLLVAGSSADRRGAELNSRPPPTERECAGTSDARDGCDATQLLKAARRLGG